MFSPFPRLPGIKSTEAYSLVAHSGHSDTLTTKYTVRRCQTAASENAFNILFIRIDEQLIKLDEEIAKAKTDRNRLFEIATSFLPQQSMLLANTGSRSPRAIGIFAAAVGAAGLIWEMFSSIHIQFMFRQYGTGSRCQQFTSATDGFSENIGRSTKETTKISSYW